MTSKEYIIWLKGFVTACNDYAPTPKQWDIIKDELEKVSDNNLPTFPFGTPNTITRTPGTTGYVTVANPYIASFNSGSTSTTYGYPSGSAWHYTNGNYINPYKPFSTQDDDSLKPKHTKKKKTVNEWEDEFELGSGE